MNPDPLTATADSIARAKATRDAERRDIELVTGLRIAENGRITRKPFIVACGHGGCRHESSAMTEARAIKGYAAHWKHAHFKEA